MSDALVVIRNASVFYPGDKERRPVLSDIDWNIQSKRHAAVLGGNGAGKSSLLKLIHGDLEPASGGIFWADGSGYSESRIAARKMCRLVSPHIQSCCAAYAWNAKVVDAIACPRATLACAANPEAEALELAWRLLGRTQSEALGNMRLPELSRGQLRLVLLLRALGSGPGLLLLDEWNSGLDKGVSKKIYDLLEEYSERLTMVFTGHRENSLPAWIGERISLEAGRISPVRTPAGEGDASHPAASAESASTRRGEIVCRLENVDVFIERKKVLHSISWELARGEHWRLSGENGSGKSTLLRLLAGDEFMAAGGRMQLYSRKLGRAVETLEDKRRLVSLVSDLSEARYDYALSAFDAVLSGCDGSVGLWREFTADERERAAGFLDFFFADSGTIAKKSIRSLSTGQLRRVFLARSLMSRPEMLLLDEPLAGLDWQARKHYLELLNKLAAGALPEVAPLIVFVSHHDEDIPEFINRHANMSEGRLTIEAQ